MSFQALAQESTTIIWQPQPGPQTALLECPVFEVFYGGARGGGHSCRGRSPIGPLLLFAGTGGTSLVRRRNGPRNTPRAVPVQHGSRTGRVPAGVPVQGPGEVGVTDSVDGADAGDADLAGCHAVGP